jgi:hypothetical protein
MSNKGNECIFHSLVKPSAPISALITGITGITNEMVANSPSFQECGRKFIQFLKDNCKQETGNLNNFEVGIDSDDDDNDDDDSGGGNDGNIQLLRDIVLVAHNGNRFDIPFLCHSLVAYGIDITGITFRAKLDTLELVKHAIKSNTTMVPPDNFQLGTIYKYLTGKDLNDRHRAEGDVKAVLEILTSEIFWPQRNEVLKLMNASHLAVANTPTSRGVEVIEDSDTDGESDLDDDSVGSEEDAVPDSGPGRWRLNTAFVPPQIPNRLEHGETCKLKVAATTVNSPMKAWRFIFTDSLLNKIVKYTNDYGAAKCSKWKDIAVSDIKDFIAIIFLAGIQKRKDKTSNWWSDDPCLEFPIVKKIMTGRKFHTILRYLHVCDLHAQPSLDSPRYTPLYKVQEFMDYIARHSSQAFEAGPSLSLDESLVRAFGRIKFKVRIITKAARYGIKIYVLADAETSYVLRVLVYTGQFTYNVATSNIDEQDYKKTVKVCKELCQPFSGSHRVVYIDRFYTSLELVKELEKMQLHVTGTMMSNRIPAEVRIAKRSRDYKEMQRGDHKMHVFEYRKDNGELSKMGLVCWKDRDVVYCVTNACNTASSSHCYRRSQSGRICISRPTVIGEYNNNMGGVDVADQIRLHSNSSIKGLHRWWLKLFFYQLDVGTSNALVLCNQATNKNINIVSFKKSLIHWLVGEKILRIVPQPQRPEHQHLLVRGEARRRCVYCDAFAPSVKRTRYYCSHPNCLLPLCLMGSDKDSRDCFALAHGNEHITSLLIQRKEKMERKDNNRPK